MKISLCRNSGLHRWGNTSTIFPTTWALLHYNRRYICAQNMTGGYCRYSFLLICLWQNFKNFGEIYMKILNFGRLLTNYITEIVFGLTRSISICLYTSSLTVKKTLFRLVREMHPGIPPPPDPPLTASSRPTDYLWPIIKAYIDSEDYGFIYL